MNNHAIGFAGTKLPHLTVLPSAGPAPQEEPEARSPGQAQPEGARKIEQSIQYMKQHLNRPLQVAELAESAHTSQSHYFALFKRWVGLSPIDYFIRLRMKQACWLLTGSSMSVKEVAVSLGYDDPFYFSRVFKSINGAAPTAYRLRQEELEQTQNSSAMPQLGEEMPLPRLPPAEHAEENGGDQRIPESAKILSTNWFGRRVERNR